MTPRPLRRRWRTTAPAACLIAALAGPACAAARTAPYDAVDVGLEYSRGETGLGGAGAALPTRVSRVGLALYEHAGSRLALGLLAGYASVSQSGQALTAGMRLTGSYLGVGLRGRLYEGARVSADAAAYYLYQYVDDETPTQSVALEWGESGATLGFALRLTGALAAYAGASYGLLDIDQQARGTVNATTRFDNVDRSGTFLGLSLEVDPGGYVALELRRGVSDGAALVFRRAYY